MNSMKKNFIKLAPELYDKKHVEKTTEVKFFPTSKTQRGSFINPKTDRVVTEFEYRVYELCKQIPEGYFSTYKAMADAIGSGSRAVGNALRKNPFAPLPVPCHRVITSDFFLGGFDGDTRTKIFWKKEILEDEGLVFDAKGYVDQSMRDRLFRDFVVS
ncbi:hypothetical protein BB560_003565 [Smittium megazygosporum]|uniref:Methylated-DNA--protein-cysteine methyltransferase n=1 Tax=Smittium megazygosporum TaxID=133381 RepID=A0A2T9ZBQ3_9FUNG|nr:hypothetical protein BB560_003565 [Smittium megazygosporum]